jgi:hypothetical protein
MLDRFRFTFTHVYIHEPINRKCKTQSLLLWFTLTYIYKNI